VCPVNATAPAEAFAEELFRGGDPPDAIAAMSDELALGHSLPPAGQDPPSWQVIPRTRTRGAGTPPGE